MCFFNKMFMDCLFVLKLFPGDPILDPRFQGPPIGKNATEVSLLGGGLVSFNSGRD